MEQSDTLSIIQVEKSVLLQGSYQYWVVPLLASWISLQASQGHLMNCQAPEDVCSIVKQATVKADW